MSKNVMSSNIVLTAEEFVSARMLGTIDGYTVAIIDQYSLSDDTLIEVSRVLRQADTAWDFRSDVLPVKPNDTKEDVFALIGGSTSKDLQEYFCGSLYLFDNGTNRYLSLGVTWSDEFERTYSHLFLEDIKTFTPPATYSVKGQEGNTPLTESA